MPQLCVQENRGAEEIAVFVGSKTVHSRGTPSTDDPTIVQHILTPEASNKDGASVTSGHLFLIRWCLFARLSVPMDIDNFYPVIHFDCSFSLNGEILEHTAFLHQVVRLSPFRCTQHRLRPTIIDWCVHPSNGGMSLPGCPFVPTSMTILPSLTQSVSDHQHVEPDAPHEQLLIRSG